MEKIWHVLSFEKPLLAQSTDAGSHDEKVRYDLLLIPHPDYPEEPTVMWMTLVSDSQTSVAEPRKKMMLGARASIIERERGFHTTWCTVLAGSQRIEGRLDAEK